MRSAVHGYTPLVTVNIVVAENRAVHRSVRSWLDRGELIGGVAPTSSRISIGKSGGTWVGKVQLRESESDEGCM